ncbi:fluoride efflux transporter FluC [Catenuloplanes atrovinosus]|uniref:Fluoride-specific ion channel FluC n=1 Tax=Catenuloplanes atrovinosus TaxID=137266 RepID=A0AAE3YVK0_9ACTN|nr:CrcB family protein [Catenuloplanes atrovinosus]MDR7280012.1 CrcB protein [Catenuloplanes atrovinosus]
MSDHRPGRPVIAVVAAGGALGAVARYALTAAWPAIWTTVAVNVIGCLAIGVLLARIADRPGVSPLLRPFLATGVLGGFTTFSAFTVQTLDLADRPPAAAAYVLATVGGSVGAAWLGARLGRRRAGSA